MSDVSGKLVEFEAVQTVGVSDYWEFKAYQNGERVIGIVFGGNHGQLPALLDLALEISKKYPSFRLTHPASNTVITVESGNKEDEGFVQTIGELQGKEQPF